MLTEEARLAWKSLFIAHALVTERVEAAFAEAGLGSLAEYDVLYTLFKAEGGALLARGLAASLTLSQSGLSRLLTRLEGRGLVRREASEHDARAQRIVLTPAGLATVDGLWEAYAEVLESAFAAALTGRELDALRRTMEKVVRPLAAGKAKESGILYLHEM